MQDLPYLAAWRAEIEAELQTLRATIALADADRAEAVEAVRTARTDRDSLAELMGRLAKRGPVASALQNRFIPYDEAVRDAEGRLARARNAIRSLLAQVSDLEMALSQLADLGVHSAMSAGSFEAIAPVAADKAEAGT